MLPLLLAGAALGLAKGIADQENEKKQRQTQAEIARWSPWTKMSPEPVKQSNMVADVAQGTLTGGMLGAANPGMDKALGGMFAGGGGADAAGAAAGGMSAAAPATPYGAGYDAYMGQRFPFAAGASPWGGVQ